MDDIDDTYHFKDKSPRSCRAISKASIEEKADKNEESGRSDDKDGCVPLSTIEEKLADDRVGERNSIGEYSEN